MALRHVEGPDKEHLTFTETWQALRISRTHLNDLIRDGKFPAGIRLGGSKKLVWHWLDVVAFVHLSGRLSLVEPPEKADRKKRPKPSTDEDSE